MPAGTFDEVDPRLAPDAHGVLRPQPGSPVLNSAVGVFPAVVVDLDGQPRPGAPAKDRGADEVSTARPVGSFLTPEVLLAMMRSWLDL
jgi:poly(beta-D-mannuronate) lyase